ncbi:protein of unknown function [Moritella yayanosii]|uniref:Uncharacterized protein n=1 Tax=Moritella yayanosii TaxID=69539 RepID=A0A330LHV4_9GAMM|nr:protein of unknown function [Moritella yayanosii]
MIGCFLISAYIRRLLIYQLNILIKQASLRIQNVVIIIRERSLEYY